MPHLPSSTPTRLVALVGAALALSLCVASAASATVTTTSITSPSDPFFAFDQGQTQNVTISGSSNGMPGDQLQILCYTDNGSTGTVLATVDNAVTVGAGGAFSATVSLGVLQQGSLGTCRLRAVPGGQLAPTTGLGAFTGPRTLVGTLTPSMNGSTLFDYFIQEPQLTTTDQYLSYSDCGLDNSFLDDPTVFGQAAVNGFFCNDLVDNPAASDSTRSGIEVDGQSAYGPYSANTKNSGATGLPPLTLGPITQNQSNGDLTFDETDPIVICANPADNPCPAFSPSGVQVKRTITQTDDGHTVSIDDAYSSTDGKSHTVNLLLENQQDFTAPNTNPVPGDVDYLFPGASQFSSFVTGQTVARTSNAPASILVQNTHPADGPPSAGSITYGQAPSSAVVFGAMPFGASTFDVPYTFTVPASGSVPIRFVYSTEFTLAAAQQDAFTAQDALQAAAVSFKSPSSGATVSSSPVTVTGGASAGSGVKSVTVNGVKATVSGGSFSASVPLTGGANTLTAVLTSNGGASASASEGVKLAVAPRATTSSATGVTATRAALTGSVTPGTAATTYQFEYGTTTAYGKSSGSGSLTASASGSPVSLSVTGLSPNATYHFRLMATSSAGKGEGNDVTFKTPRAAPSRISDSVRPRSDHKAPFKYRFGGSITLPAGVSPASACKGAVAVTVKRGHKKVMSRRLKVNGKCKFAGKVSFKAAKLHGNGKLSFSFRFDGNGVLAAKNGKSITVRFG
jgi:hypothetical protein